MTRRRRLALLLPALMFLAVVLAWAFEATSRGLPSLEPIAQLASAGNFAGAQAILDKVLADHPAFADAHLLAAQLQLDRPEKPTGGGERPDPAPARAALAHLARIQPADPRRDALVALYRGKALYRLAELDKAEAQWLTALRLEPTVPEAGWCLLEMYYLEGRAAEARALALRLHATEPDPRDRVQFLLELLREDAQSIAPESAVQWFEAAARQAPGDLHVGLALGLAEARTGQSAVGLDRLARLAREHPADADAWDAWLTGLDDAGEVAQLEEAVAELPPPLARSPRFVRHHARLAQERGDWREAVAGYRRALEATPADQAVAYRLARALRQAGDVAGAEPIEANRLVVQEASRAVRPLYEEANAIPDFGTVPRPEIYRRIADLREKLGLAAEARAWNQLILSARPDDPPSRAALARLGR